MPIIIWYQVDEEVLPTRGETYYNLLSLQEPNNIRNASLRTSHKTQLCKTKKISHQTKIPSHNNIKVAVLIWNSLSTVHAITEEAKKLITAKIDGK